MYRLVERRSLWFLLSLIGISPGIIFMLWNLTSAGTFLPLSIDYTGGTQWEMRFNQPVAPTEVGTVFVDAGFSDTKAFLVDDERTVQVKFKNIDISQKEVIAQAIVERFGEFDERLYRSIGPAIGGEVSRAALLAVIAASILILAYIAFAFREIAHPFRYGVAAIAALVHDVLITVSFLSIMNLIAGWELDALFLTATLTVIGFSVNDTIVIFDRIRENLRRHRGEPLASVANRSIIETAQRSIATQVTALLVLAAILIYGGFTLRIFMATLIVGLISGTYSSIFTATPLVVAWEEGSLLAGAKRRVAAGKQTAPA
ncbi:MAG: protein translocase subunit SecF [Caldilineaceae bacterium]|nr:protein translocase subunit SecF [Caldilineaceae bacterium]MDE0070860.1 protein translocase subunit SecF [Caldilineaceae bacterium]MDE0180892.1 protein translocase subunit SecF [Caldilineaceae bacterium]